MRPALDELREIFAESVSDVDLDTTSTFLDEYQRKQNQPGDLAEVFHENTKYKEENMWETRSTNDQFHTDALVYAQTEITPDYSYESLHELPDPEPLSGSIADCLANRQSHREFSEETLSQQALSDILHWACGINRTTSVSGVTERHYRTYPSGGALYPVEIYPCILDCEGISPGVYFYSAEKHGLRVLDVDFEDFSESLANCFTGPEDVFELYNSNVVFVLAGVFWRSKAKYGPRGYRLTLQESGHIVQNIGLVSGAKGLGSVPIAGFYDDDLNALLGLDGVNEAVVYTTPVGTIEVSDA